MSAAPLVERARELRGRLERDTPETHALLREGGFHALLVPAHHGGEASGALASAVDAVAELARHSPAGAWTVAASAAAAATLAAGFPPDVQAEVFADGCCCVALASAPARAALADGGWVIDGALEGCAGARDATHLLGRAVVLADAPAEVTFIAPRSAYELRAEEGGRPGLPALGTRTIELRGARLDARRVLTGPRPAVAVEQALLAAVFVGAAAAAAERYEELVLAARAPLEPRAADPDWQRRLGAVLARATSAELLLAETAAQHAARPPAPADDLRLAAMAREALRLAWAAIAEGARTADGAGAGLAALASELLPGVGEASVATEESLARGLARARLGV